MCTDRSSALPAGFPLEIRRTGTPVFHRYLGPYKIPILLAMSLLTYT